MGVYENIFSWRKIYFAAYLNNRCNWLQNNTTQLHLTLGRAELYLNFSRIPEDGTDIHRFQRCTWLRPSSCCKICEYQSHPQLYRKNSNVVLLFLIQKVIVQYYFGVDYIGYLDMLQNIFSYMKKKCSHRLSC